MGQLQNYGGVRLHPWTHSGSRRCAPWAGVGPGHSAAGPPPQDTPGRPHGDGEPGPRRRLDAGTHIAVLGTWIALVPVAMVFTGLIVADLALRSAARTPVAVPQPRLLGFEALALLMACAALQRAGGEARRGHPATAWIGVALAAGAAFMGGLAWVWHAWAARGFVPGRAPVISFYYVLTGAHGLHVAGGLLVLLAILRWPRRGWRGTPLEVALQAVAVYWNFVTGVWLVLLVILTGPR
jgi:cytochrome c oxidase subunit III